MNRKISKQRDLLDKNGLPFPVIRDGFMTEVEVMDAIMENLEFLNKEFLKASEYCSK